MSSIDVAVEIAQKAHRGQKEKNGRPYIEHSIRVMREANSEAAQIVAVLHDVVEDTAVTLADLRAAGFSDRVLAGIDAITKRPGEDYDAYIERLAADDLALEVKLADLRDNLDAGRLPGAPTVRDLERFDRYRIIQARLRAIARERLKGWVW